MASSSSAKKVAKLAQKGKGKKVRFQGGTLFPLIVVIVVLLFGGLIVYARQSRPGPGEGAPTANDHWHAAYGMYVCDANGLQMLPKLQGTLEETDANGQLVSTKFQKTGIHSHGDGVMHWHPTSSGAATGSNATLGVFLNNYDVTLTDTKLALPKSQGGNVFEEGKSVCKIDGVEKTASLKLWVWDHYSSISPTCPATTDVNSPTVFTKDMTGARIKNDGMVFVIAFVPDDVKPCTPDWASNLLALGAADGSANPNATTTTVAGTPGTGSTSGSTPTSDTTASSVGSDSSTPSSETASTAPTTTG